jgi:hypothetical protein
MIVSHTFVSDWCYAKAGITETCDCIPSIVSHTLLHTLPTLGSIPKNSERRSMVIYGHAHILRESLVEMRERYNYMRKPWV